MKIKENEVIEDVMKMEVLSVQNQFQGHFGMIGSTKVRGKFNEILFLNNSISSSKLEIVIVFLL